MYEVIIVGAGPAGISAGLYTYRANIKTLIINTNKSVLLKAGSIENYYGFDNISGKDLINKGIDQAKNLGIELIDDEVVAMEMDDGFTVITKEQVYNTESVLLATGQPYKKIGIKNIDKFDEGKGISYCTTCDGFFYKDAKVGIIGFKDFAIHEANELKAFTKDITIFTNGNKLDISDKYRDDLDSYRVVENKIVEVKGNEFIEEIEFENGEYENISGLFIAYDSASSSDFARKLGILVNKNSIQVDNKQKTNLDGVFAAGDCTGGFKQISTSVGEGAIAAKGIIEYVRKKK